MGSDRNKKATIFIAFFAALLGSTICSYSGGMLKSFLAKDDVIMRQIPGGVFRMGSGDPDIKEISKVHKVYIKTFFIDEHPVTNRQFAAFLNDVRPSEKIAATADEEQAGASGSEPAPEDGNLSSNTPERLRWVVLRSDLVIEERKGWWPTEILFERGKYVALEGFEDYPVISVSFEAAEKYCKWTGKRLPTEAEWEKAARGGLRQKKFPWGDSLPTEGIVYNRQWVDNQAPPPLEKVKTYLPNNYGIYDTAGLVWEWCSDWFDPFYYEKSSQKNPAGPASGGLKILRGGSWFNPTNALRVGLRNFIPPVALDETTGFRCVADFPGAHNVKK